MNWDQVEGQWKDIKGVVREKWGKLTDDDFEIIAGKKDRLLGKLQVRHGLAVDEAEKQIEIFLKSLDAKVAKRRKN